MFISFGRNPYASNRGEVHIARDSQALRNTEDGRLYTQPLEVTEDQAEQFARWAIDTGLWLCRCDH